MMKSMLRMKSVWVFILSGLTTIAFGVRGTRAASRIGNWKQSPPQTASVKTVDRQDLKVDAGNGQALRMEADDDNGEADEDNEANEGGDSGEHHDHEGGVSGEHHDHEGGDSGEHETEGEAED